MTVAKLASWMRAEKRWLTIGDDGRLLMPIITTGVPSIAFLAGEFCLYQSIDGDEKPCIAVAVEDVVQWYADSARTTSDPDLRDWYETAAEKLRAMHKRCGS